jgi:hypothetical protein
LVSKRRSRRLLLTTKTLEQAIAPPGRTAPALARVKHAEPIPVG